MLQAFADGHVFGAVHGSAPPWLLCLPGWGRSHGDFDGVVQGLDAIVLDLPGFGTSPPPPEAWDAADYAAAIAAVMDQMSSPAVVLGHSFGGRVAVHLAVHRAELVAGLVLTGVPLVTRPGARPRRLARAYRLARALHRRGLVGDRRMEALRQRYGSPDYRAATGVMRQVHVRVVNETYEEQLSRITCPAELVWGDDDPEVPVAVAQAASGLLGRANLTVVPGIGHLTPLTAPDQLRAAAQRCRA